MKLRPPDGGFYPVQHPFDPAEEQSPNLDEGPNFDEDFNPDPLIPKARRDGAPLHVGPRVQAPEVRSMTGEDFGKTKVFGGELCHHTPSAKQRYCQGKSNVDRIGFLGVFGPSSFQTGRSAPGEFAACGVSRRRLL